MISLPVPSWRTTRAMAHFLRPVPMIVWAANPPGSLDFTYFFRSAVSTSWGEATVASTVRGRGGVLVESESELGRAKERPLGLWEIWDENEREEREEVSEDNNVIVDIFLQFFFVFSEIWVSENRSYEQRRAATTTLLCTWGPWEAWDNDNHFR